jgi:hypothetical protein
MLSPVHRSRNQNNKTPEQQDPWARPVSDRRDTGLALLRTAAKRQSMFCEVMLAGQDRFKALIGWERKI